MKQPAWFVSFLRRSSLGKSSTVAAMLLVASFGTGSVIEPTSPARAAEAPPATSDAEGEDPKPFDLHTLIPKEDLAKANRGRDVVGADGLFRFPPEVKRVWVDVGAHFLELSLVELLTREDVGIVAIEPIPEARERWVDNPRLIAIPAAIYLERGTRDFYVTVKDATSSLAPGLAGAKHEDLRKTERVIQVPVVRLDDILRRIPEDLQITFLKTDVQSLDLQVLKSGGTQLERAFRIRTEVINDKRYEEIDGQKSGTEAEFVEYLGTRGFQFVRDVKVAENREHVDKEFVNVKHPRYLH